MGMFDNIKCELPLPLNKKEQKTFSNVDWNDRVFQTKDTDCTLSTYIIRKNGKLYGLFIEGENVRVISEEEEKKIKRKGKFCWPYEFKEKSRKYKFEKFTGDLYFYDHVIDKDGNEWWVEFVTKFIDGVIKGKIKKKEVKFSQSAEDIKKVEEDWQERIAKEQAKPSTKIKRNLNKYTFGYWRNFWITLGGYIRKFANKIQHLDIWINRNIA
jgi:hypothetical protein